MRPAAALPPVLPAAAGSRPGRVQSFPNLTNISQANSPPAPAELHPLPPLPPSYSLAPSPPTTSAFTFPTSQPRVPVLSPSPVQHVPRPRFHSFELGGAEEEDEEKPSSPQLMPAAAASTSPLLASQPQRSPDASPHSNSNSPQRSQSPGTLSFSEKRKLAKEAAKDAAAKPAKQQRPHAPTRWDSWRRWLQHSWAGLHALHETKAFWLCVYSAALLLTSVGNSIYFKKMINKMENYVYFLNQFTTVMSADHLPAIYSLQRTMPHSDSCLPAYLPACLLSLAPVQLHSHLLRCRLVSVPVH